MPMEFSTANVFPNQQSTYSSGTVIRHLAKARADAGWSRGWLAWKQAQLEQEKAEAGVRAGWSLSSWTMVSHRNYWQWECSQPHSDVEQSGETHRRLNPCLGITWVDPAYGLDEP